MANKWQISGKLLLGPGSRAPWPRVPGHLAQGPAGPLAHGPGPLGPGAAQAMEREKIKEIQDEGPVKGGSISSLMTCVKERETSYHLHQPRGQCDQIRPYLFQL